MASETPAAWATSETLGHDEVGLDQAIGRLARYRQPHALPVAIETTNGAVVDALAAGPKSDPGDSWKLADLLCTDGHRLPAYGPWTPPP